MERLICLALAVTIAGCAITQEQFMDEARRSTASLQLPPGKAANCITRNLPRIHSDLVPTTYQIDDGGSIQVILRVGSIRSAIIQLVPNGTGSAATSWWRPIFQNDWNARAVHGC